MTVISVLYYLFEYLLARNNFLKVNVFVALGGNTDKTGTISREKLSELIKRFELTISLQSLVKFLENDGKGNITYNSLVNFLAH